VIVEMRSGEVALTCGTGSGFNRDIVFCNFYQAASSNLGWCRHCVPVRAKRLISSICFCPHAVTL